MRKFDIPINFNDLEKGTTNLLKNIDTFKSYETIEFEKEEDDQILGKKWEIMINNFGHVKVEICRPGDSATFN